MGDLKIEISYSLIELAVTTAATTPTPTPTSTPTPTPNETRRGYVRVSGGV
jgi:hypothetical protein